MDKSLAIGFSKLFFRETDDAIRKVIENLSQKKKWKISRSGWSKFCNDAKNQLGSMALLTYEGGSVRKPYFAYMGLLIDEERTYNNWQERCVTGRVCINDFSSGACKVYPALFNISEHAIRRLIQRSLTDPANFQSNIFLVLDELKYVPLWSSYWFQIVFSYTNSFSDKQKLDQFQLIIPAPNGIFFAKISNEIIPKIEIRTYVHDLQLSEDQIQIKTAMLNASKALENSPLSFSPIIEMMCIDDCFALVKLISYRLRSSYKLLAQLLFENVVDDEQRAIEKSMFAKFFINSITDFSELFSNEVDRLGVRAFQLEIRKGIMKAEHNE